MNKKLPFLIIAGLILGSASLFAQDKRFEVHGLLGYTFSEGVDVRPQQEDTLGIRRLSPKSDVSYGLGLEYYFAENLSVGFNFSQQHSKLSARVQDLDGVDITGLNVNNFHGIFTYIFADEDETLRPFVFGGLGATVYSPGSIAGNATEGSTRFSTTWGGGVKYFTTERIGFRAGIRWTPTHFESEPGGVWNNQYWPWNGWMVENPNYSHQFELTVGVILRF
jgi:opacity protein-like surface antigen